MVHTDSHCLVHSFNIYLISLLAKGTSFTQYILSDGPCSIFFIVPELDLNILRVTIWSSLSGSDVSLPSFNEKVSKVEKPEDYDRCCFSFGCNMNLESESGCSGSIPKPCFFIGAAPLLPTPLLLLYYSNLEYAALSRSCRVLAQVGTYQVEWLQQVLHLFELF